MFDRSSYIVDCLEIRRQAPLIHNITNFVAMNPCANALLAVGASPLMSFCPEEMVDLVSASAAVAVNIGCLDAQLVKAAKIAAASASGMGKPWVLDPVGVGASSLRTEVAADLTAHYHPTVIRGNASEILCLAMALKLVDKDAALLPKGVDSSAVPAAACNAAMEISLATGAAVSISGATDYIVFGREMATISNGSPLMPRVTALGCTATAITAAFLAVNPNPFAAALHAMALMGTTGETAAADCPGTGTFAARFIDALSTYDAHESSKLVRE